MGLRLRILSWWTPQFVIRKELSNVSNQTISALEALIAPYSPQETGNDVRKKPMPQTSIGGQRAAMAETQAQLVDALEAAVGHKQAVKLCRAVLFTVGRHLGQETRIRLGVGNRQEDLIRAAKVLYRILGIEFKVEWIDNTNLKLIITRCALAEQYSALTCEALSATDEGTITGLQPNAAMRFTQYMTGGCEKCKAAIRFTEAEAVQ